MTSISKTNMSTLPHLLKTGVENTPNKTAIIYQEKEYRYRYLQEKIDQLIAGFARKLHLEKGDVLAIQSSNTIEYVLTLLASWRAGVVLTPLNPALKPDEIQYQLNNSEAKAFIYEGYVEEKAIKALEQCERPIQSICFGKEKHQADHSFEALFCDNPPVLPHVSEDDLALIIYTSGTTGKPKGVLLTHHNFMVMADMSIEALQLTERDRSFLILPLFHVNAIMFTLTAVLMKGGSVVINKRFDVDEFLPAVDRYQPTFTSGVPTVYRMLANLPEGIEKNYNLSSMRFGICGAAPVSVQLFKQFESRYPFKLIEGWGLSEGTTASTLNPLDGKRKVGSIGKAMKGQEIKVVDHDGKEIPTGEKGELIVRGANVMKGYYKREDETKKTLKDGWLYTGDIGYQDEDGFYYIVDRKKDMIIRGGMNIYPKQIEEVLYQLPGVLEVAVIGVPDEKYGEEVEAFVVQKEGYSLTEAEVKEFCQRKMANYLCPKRVHFIDSLPKNSVGKITKGVLRDLRKHQSFNSD